MSISLNPGSEEQHLNNSDNPHPSDPYVGVECLPIVTPDERQNLDVCLVISVAVVLLMFECRSIGQ